MKTTLPPLALVALLLLLFPPLLAEENPVEAARQKLEQAQAERKAVEGEMQETFLALETDFRLVGSEKWKTLSSAFRRAIGSADEARRSGGDGAWPAALAESFRRAGGLHHLTADRLSAAATEEIAALAEAKADPAEVLAAAVRRVFPEETFADCWDRHFQDLPVVTRWRDANDVVARAEEELRAATAAAAAASAGGTDPGEPGAAGDSGGPPGMVLVPTGRFTYGPATGLTFDLEKNRETRERLSGFYIDVHEVTNEQYLAYLRKKWKGKEKKLPAGYLPTGFAVAADGAISFPDGEGKLPVRGVSYSAAEAYAESVGKRLPTEEEWEKAARGEDGLPYPWGEEWDAAAPNHAGHGPGRPVPVGTSPKDRSPYGVMDMAGNVSELTSTFSDRKPRRGRLGTADAITYRGGNYSDDETACVTTYRWTIPALGEGEEKVGFRCAMSERDWK